jgi:hypothetical protein
MPTLMSQNTDPVKVGGNEKKVGREGGKWSEYAWERVRVLFSFNLAAILKKFCSRFRSLQPND